MLGKPIVGISACRKFIEPHYFYAAGEKYISAISVAAKATPVLIPAIGLALDVDALLQRLDGLLFTGSPSNVEPRHYHGVASRPGTLHDVHRDATTLPLIRHAIDAGVPILAICRGFQELNVAFGGTLHQHVHEIDGLANHREDNTEPLEVQYAEAHDVELCTGGILEGLAGTRMLRVNSLHSQGVDQLGTGLTAEAVAADGLVEAFRVTDARALTVAVQWHPEWQVVNNPFYTVLFEAFGGACRQRQQLRDTHERRTAYAG